MKQKFILTNDKITADKFMAAGFTIVARQGDTYLFMNQSPKNFSLESCDNTKFCYTNILTF